MNYRPPDWIKGGNPVVNGVQYHNYDEVSYEAGGDDLLRLLEPIIRDKAPSSSLIDLFYGRGKEVR